MYCKFDHSEMIFGPFEKMTFFGEHPLVKSINVHMIGPGECTRQADSCHIDITLLGLIGCKNIT